MPLFIGLVSQKGGVGKSSLSRAIAREYVENDWKVQIADMDVSQGTSFNWQKRRVQNKIMPGIEVEQFTRVEQAIRLADNYNLVVFDGAPHSNQSTLRIAQVSDLVIIPTGPCTDDLEPTIKLAHEIKREGIDKAKLAIVLYRIGDSKGETEEAMEYIKESGYFSGVFLGLFNTKYIFLKVFLIGFLRLVNKGVKLKRKYSMQFLEKKHKKSDKSF